MAQLAHLAQAHFGLTLTGQQLAAFDHTLAALQRANQQLNLTAITDTSEIVTRHFLDSLSLVPLLPDTPARLQIIDVGTGAGFPGLPLKFARPQHHITLNDSVGKKCDYLRALVTDLALKDIEVVHGRAEDLGQHPDHREAYDVAAARAVAHLPVLLEYLLPLVRVGGVALVMKGPSAAEELAASDNALRTLGGHLRELREVQLPGLADPHILAIIDKIACTPPAYPRRPGMPAKRPL